MSDYLIVETSTSMIKVTPLYIIITTKFGNGELKIPIDSITHITLKSSVFGFGKIEFHHTGKGVLQSGVGVRNIVNFSNTYEESKIQGVKRLTELYKSKNYGEDEVQKVMMQNKVLEDEGKIKLKKQWKISGVVVLSIAIIGGMAVYNMNNESDTYYIPTTNNEEKDNFTPNTPTYSNNSSNNISPYTKEELEANPTAPSTDPRDYNANGEYVPHDGPSNNPADYDMNTGKYRPIEDMTKEEIQAEVVEMMKKNGVGQ
ncbi:hypothetical protein [Aneurinibacillus tyrosinisolvens]|uniref:hypothetical protein n=1 Tax=Aneurinibacillus tyrosinisolvens TaxID=1443435 RepID=UPI00063F27AA|nr:hypothetical protein [Aneurinibacillus tyrosinisolvens]